MKLQRAPLLALPLLLLLTSSCGDSDLTKVAKALDVTAQTIGLVQTTVIEANKQGLITVEETRSILEVSIKVNLAGQQAVKITRTISKLDNPTKAQLLTILTPVIQAVNESIDSGLVGIKNEQTKAQIKAYLVVIQTALNGVNIILAGG
jgi:hypothetical protein